MKKRTYLFNFLAITALFLGACNLPSGTSGNDAAGTAAAETVQAMLASATSLPVISLPSSTPLPVIAATNTPIPLPVFTNTALPTATSNCNVMQFVADVTYPDNTVVTPGSAFVKTWRIKNIGTCAWTPSYAIVFSSGNAMNGPSTQALAGNVNPGQTLDVSVSLTAPATPGDYRGDWKIRDASGVLFGAFYVQIKSQVAAAATNTSAPAFAVTNVSFSVPAVSCGSFSYSYTITVNGAGTVTSHRVFSDGGTDTLPRTLTFSGAGSQTITEPASFGVAGTSIWTDIYIDTPNHQQFGRATFTCP